MTLTKRILLTAGAMLLPVVAAQAEKKPTLVLMHRNIENVTDESNWLKLSAGLAHDGYKVISVALTPSEDAVAGRDHLTKLLDQYHTDEKFVLVGTAAVNETASMVAQAEKARIKAVVYISAEDSVKTLGPHQVNVPATLGIVSYQVRITNAKHVHGLAEQGANTFQVREEGSSTLAKMDDLIVAINTVADKSTRA